MSRPSAPLLNQCVPVGLDMALFRLSRRLNCSCIQRLFRKFFLIWFSCHQVSGNPFDRHADAIVGIQFDFTHYGLVAQYSIGPTWICRSRNRNRHCCDTPYYVELEWSRPCIGNIWHAAIEGDA